jgi:hypothetical protein
MPAAPGSKPPWPAPRWSTPSSVRSAPENEVAPLIAAARDLVRKSGGDSLLPRLREAEARMAGRGNRAILEAGLREAEKMYREMGAQDPADRLVQELKR